MQRISKDLMEGMFQGNALKCECATAAELESTYQSALLVRRSFYRKHPRRVYTVKKAFEGTAGYVEVTRMDDSEDTKTCGHGGEC